MVDAVYTLSSNKCQSQVKNENLEINYETQS